MSHHGYIPFVVNFLARRQVPRFLEIGVDRGQTLIPVLHWLSVLVSDFRGTSIDIREDESLKIILTYMGFGTPKNPKHNFIIANSLDYLPSCTDKFDVVLLDGDHNFYTVSRELELLKNMVVSDGIIIVDDYHGRWAERDLFYAERETHKGIQAATQRVITEKAGVKAAVDEFVEKNLGWEITQLMPGEPVILRRKQGTNEND